MNMPFQSASTGSSKTKERDATDESFSHPLPRPRGTAKSQVAYLGSFYGRFQRINNPDQQGGKETQSLLG